MILDKIENLDMYANLKDYANIIKSFIKRSKEEMLPEGRYDIVDGRLFALIQRYETHDQNTVRMESHKKYIDLQVVLEGEELIFWNLTDELQVIEDCTSDNDILFYKSGNEENSFALKKDMFVYFSPQDAHQPGCILKIKSNVLKIVFKLLAA